MATIVPFPVPERPLTAPEPPPRPEQGRWVTLAELALMLETAQCSALTDAGIPVPPRLVQR